MDFFARPEAFLLLLALVPFLALFVFWEVKKIWKIEAELSLSYTRAGRKVSLKAVLFLFSVTPLIFLLAEPTFKAETSEEMANGTLIFMFDTSKSMQARSSLEAPSRIDRSKEIALRVLDDTRSVDMSVCVFGAVANCLVPISEPTRDKKILEAVIEDFVLAGYSYGKGSDVVGSLRSITESAKEDYSDSKKPPMIIVFTDGEETVRADSRKAFAQLRNSGISFVLVGVGEKEGAKIPIFSERSGAFAGIYETFKGKDYISFMKEEYLKGFARSIGGTYFFESDRGRLAEFVKAAFSNTPQPDLVGKVAREDILSSSLIGLAIVFSTVFIKKYVM